MSSKANFSCSCPPKRKRTGFRPGEQEQPEWQKQDPGGTEDETDLHGASWESCSTLLPDLQPLAHLSGRDYATQQNSGIPRVKKLWMETGSQPETPSSPLPPPLRMFPVNGRSSVCFGQVPPLGRNVHVGCNRISCITVLIRQQKPAGPEQRSGGKHVKTVALETGKCPHV